MTGVAIPAWNANEFGPGSFRRHTMNLQEIQHLLAEQVCVKRLLADIPLEDVLDRSSLQCRLEMIEHELSEINPLESINQSRCSCNSCRDRKTTPGPTELPEWGGVTQ
jgi:hypothetical protein